MRELITDKAMPDIRPALIKAIRDRPGLWNVHHPQFKMKVLYAELWNEVVAELPASPNINVETVKKQWKNMKDTYRKELKRPFQQWCYCKEMSFMKNILINGRRLSSPSTWIHNDLELNSQEVDETVNSNNVQHNVQVFYQRDLTEPFGWIPKRSNSFSEPEQVNIQEPGIVIQNLQEEVNMNTSQMSEPEKSEDYHFLMSILPEMEKLSPMQKMRVRTKINGALFEEMSQNYNGREEQGGPTSAKQKRKRSIS